MDPHRTPTDREIKGLGSYRSKMTWHDDIIQCDVDPHYMCHVASEYK
jgi:hypothetical protein